MMQRRERRRILDIVAGRYMPFVGWIKEEFVDGKWRITGDHVKRCSSSERKQFLKRQSNRRVRRNDDIAETGKNYKKQYDVWFKLY